MEKIVNAVHPVEEVGGCRVAVLRRIWRAGSQFERELEVERGRRSEDRLQEEDAQRVDASDRVVAGRRIARQPATRRGDGVAGEGDELALDVGRFAFKLGARLGRGLRAAARVDQASGSLVPRHALASQDYIGTARHHDLFRFDLIFVQHVEQPCRFQMAAHRIPDRSPFHFRPLGRTRAEARGQVRCSWPRHSRPQRHFLQGGLGQPRIAGV